MHTNLADQETVGVFPVYDERCRLEAGFFAGLVVVKNSLEALALGPAQVHSKQHFRPILRLGATCAWMNRDDGIPRVILSREQGLGFQAVHQLPQRVDLATKLSGNAFPFMGQLEIGGNIFAPPDEVSLGGQHVLQTLLLAHDLLGLLGIRPEIRIDSLLFDFS